MIEFNREAVKRTGEPFQVRDLALLESACARPHNIYGYGERDLVKLAVSLLMGLARNHPFAQGNKRTALKAADAFLMANGYRIDPAFDGVRLADEIVAIIEHRWDESAFTESLRPNIVGV